MVTSVKPRSLAMLARLWRRTWGVMSDSGASSKRCFQWFGPRAVTPRYAMAGGQTLGRDIARSSSSEPAGLAHGDHYYEYGHGGPTRRRVRFTTYTKRPQRPALTKGADVGHVRCPVGTTKQIIQDGPETKSGRAIAAARPTVCLRRSGSIARRPAVERNLERN